MNIDWTAPEVVGVLLVLREHYHCDEEEAKRRFALSVKELMMSLDATEEEATGAVIATDGLSEDRAIERLLPVITAREIARTQVEFERGLDADFEVARTALETKSWDPKWEELDEAANTAYKRSDYRAAYELFLEAAKLGHPSSVQAVGSALRYGAGVRNDMERSARWFALFRRHAGR